MARSCFVAAALVLNVPRFLRFPVFGFFFREYSRYLPDFSFLIITSPVWADCLFDFNVPIGLTPQDFDTADAAPSRDY
jgi:hypothetical protein